MVVGPGQCPLYVMYLFWTDLGLGHSGHCTQPGDLGGQRVQSGRYQPPHPLRNLRKCHTCMDTSIGHALYY